MFVVSVNDNGEERNLVASHVRVFDYFILIQAGGVSHAFPVATLMDIVAVDAVTQISKPAYSQKAIRFH
jgi:hypothetical protein